MEFSSILQHGSSGRTVPYHAPGMLPLLFLPLASSCTKNVLQAHICKYPSPHIQAASYFSKTDAPWLPLPEMQEIHPQGDGLQGRGLCSPLKLSPGPAFLSSQVTGTCSSLQYNLFQLPLSLSSCSVLKAFVPYQGYQ